MPFPEPGAHDPGAHDTCAQCGAVPQAGESCQDLAHNRRMLGAFAADQLPDSREQQRAFGLRSARDAFEGSARVIRRPAVPRIRIPWTRTVFDIDFSDGPAYVRTVEDWARRIAHHLDTHLGPSAGWN